tara:strand:+ start:134 stop:352 length:219 start_codon:yes stop_codon:yes gene_type:complete
MAKKSKKATISANSSTDLHLVLLWLKANDAISSSGAVKKRGSQYTSSVNLKLDKKKVSYLAKDRFGTFVRVN